MDLAPKTQRLLVDDENIGIEYLGGVLDDRGPHRQGFLDVDVKVERRVLAVAELDHAWNTYEIDARAEVEAADNR